MSSIVLKDVIRFRGDRLFDGAVNLSWFWDDIEKSHKAAESFVFHGPQYHGVQQSDIGISHGHQLQDTATFTKNIVNACYGDQDQPFTLAIAGYGTGKSHLALTIANLLSNPDSDVARNILSNIEDSDINIGKEIKLKFLEFNRPCLVVALNGMQNFDLTAEISRQIYKQIIDRNVDTTPLDELRPRFVNAIKILNILSDSLKEELLKHCDVSNFESILTSLREQDEHLYLQIHEFLTKHGVTMQAIGGESVEDIIKTVSKEYCGQDKPFQSLVFLFDEFGRYIEFATTHSQIAGSGALQNLFEGIQSCTERTCFFGFIQFELNAYVQRILPEYKNDILRYITRYQFSNKVYLSINLETLIANLIQKNDITRINSLFDTESAFENSIEISKNISKWFLQSRNHELWNRPELFHKVISKGCWPLSPFSTWFLYHLTASGKHLQERSALVLLGGVFRRFSDFQIPDINCWSLSPADLWTDEIQQEFIGSEELGQQGSITHAYTSVVARYGERLSEISIKILQTIVLASKMSVQVDNRNEALLALSRLSGLQELQVKQEIDQLQDEYNIIEWDETLKLFDILGDTASRTQFLSFLRQKVLSFYNEEEKSKLFMGKAANWSDLLKDLDCDFAEENRITTKEWYYRGITSNLEMLDTNLRLAADYWEKAIAIDEPRGSIIYCYVNQHYELQEVISKSKKQLITLSNEKNISALPIIVVFLYDKDGKLGQYLAEYSILQDQMSTEDIERFGNLVKVYKEKVYTLIQNQLESMLKDRLYIISSPQKIESNRLKVLATELFNYIYSNVLQFPFDGFSTSRGNAANTCFQLTNELLQGILDYNKVLALPPREKNRSLTVLKNHWGIFNKDGSISRKPKNPVVQMILEEWDRILESDKEHFSIGNELIKIFKPPYGANIASASLLLGVYLAPRIDSLIIQEDGKQFAISQLIQDNNIFKGKFLDINRLKNMELIKIGDESTNEWERILDEWENEESYKDKIKYFLKAEELKSRIPIPNKLIYRYDYLCQQSIEAEKEIKKMDENINKGLMRMERAQEEDNIGKLSRGADELLELQEKMLNERPAWTDHQINELTPHIEKAKQLIIQDFSKWLSRQMPMGNHPDQIGKFKHWLLDLVGGNLQKLGLVEQFKEIEKRAYEVTEWAEKTAQVKQLARDIQSFLQINREDAFRIIRLAKIRGLQKTAGDYISEANELSIEITLEILNDNLTHLLEFMNKLKETEKEIMDQAIALWDTKIYSEKELNDIQIQVAELIQIFEGCERDLADLHAMGKALKMFKQSYVQLDDDLTWTQFEALSENIAKEIKESFSEDEIPWSIDDIISCLLEEIRRKRIDKSSNWLNSIRSEYSTITSMSTSEASRLHSTLSSPSVFITEQDMKEINNMINQIERHLNKLAIDWLIEKFKELSDSSKKEFLEIAKQILETEQPKKNIN